MKKGKWLYLALPVLMLFSLSGCSGRIQLMHSALMEFSGKTDHSYYSTYQKMSGTEILTISLGEDDPPEIRVSVTTDEGQLAISLKDAESVELYNGENLETSQFIISVESGKTYTLTLKGADHSGGYNIAWGPVEMESEVDNP